MIDWLFNDSQKNKVYYQFPNWQITLASIFFLAGITFQGSIATIFSVLFVASLGYWAYLEIFYGVNRFRILLGILATVMLFFYVLNLFN